MGKVGQRISVELQDAAKEFASNVGPVLGIVKGGIDAITALGADLVMPENLTTKLESLSTVIAELARWVGTAALTVGADLQIAAKEFAGNVGAVTGIVKGGAEAMVVLAGDIVMPTDLTAKLETLSSFLGQLVTWVGTAAQTVSAELQAAAKDFASNLNAVTGSVKSSVEAITALQKAPVVDTAGIGVALTGLSGAVDLIVLRVGSMAETSGTAIESTALFLERIKVVLTTLHDAMVTLKNIAELEAPAVGLAWVTALETAMSAAVPSLETALAAVVSAFETALTNLQAGSYAAGYGFMTSLAERLTAGLTYVESALTALAELFPHSPAKAGPLRVAPDWSAWMLGGLGDATNMVSSGLGWTMPRGLIPGSLGGTGHEQQQHDDQHQQPGSA